MWTMIPKIYENMNDDFFKTFPKAKMNKKIKFFIFKANDS